MKTLSMVLMISVAATGLARAANDLNAVDAMVSTHILELHRLEALGSALVADTTGEAFTNCASGILGDVQNVLSRSVGEHQEIRRIVDMSRPYTANMFEKMFIDMLPITVTYIDGTTRLVLRRAAQCDSHRIDDFGIQTSTSLKAISHQLQALEIEMRKNFTPANP